MIEGAQSIRNNQNDPELPFDSEITKIIMAQDWNQESARTLDHHGFELFGQRRVGLLCALNINDPIFNHRGGVRRQRSTQPDWIYPVLRQKVTICRSNSLDIL